MSQLTPPATITRAHVLLDALYHHYPLTRDAIENDTSYSIGMVLNHLATLDQELKPAIPPSDSLQVGQFTVTAEPAQFGYGGNDGTEHIQQAGDGDSIVVTIIDKDGVGGQFWMRPGYRHVAFNRFPPTTTQQEA